MSKQPIAFEVITPVFGNSFALQSFDEQNINHYKSWHYHPEIELVYINGGAGKRQIGSHMSYFNDGDLILIGKNLPHCGFTDRFTGNKKETLVQFKEDFLGPNFFDIPEMIAINDLFELSKQGLAFHGITINRSLLQFALGYSHVRLSFGRVIPLRYCCYCFGHANPPDRHNPSGH